MQGIRHFWRFSMTSSSWLPPWRLRDKGLSRELLSSKSPCLTEPYNLTAHCTWDDQINFSFWGFLWRIHKSLSHKQAQCHWSRDPLTYSPQLASSLPSSHSGEPSQIHWLWMQCFLSAHIHSSLLHFNGGGVAWVTTRGRKRNQVIYWKTKGTGKSPAGHKLGEN